MRQPEPNRDSQAFLSALADEILSGPSEATARRHVTATAAMARSATSPVRSHAVRWVAAAIAVTTVFGTGGIAAAGALPGPIQSVVADAARALPVPVHIPYPDVEVADTRAAPSKADRALDGAEIEEEPPVPTGDNYGVAVPSAPPAGDTLDHGLEPEAERQRGHDRRAEGTCALHVPAETNRRDMDREAAEELREGIRRSCDPGFVDPPSFTRDSTFVDSHPDERGDEDRENPRDHDVDRRDDGWRGSDDAARGDDEDDAGDRDGTGFDWSDEEGSDQSNDSVSNEQEERHDDDEDEGEEHSSNDGWRDRHD